MNWLYTCQTLRENSDIPLLMLTLKREKSQKIKGLQLGTDDYLVKPFNPLEMTVRVKALLRPPIVSRSSKPCQLEMCRWIEEVHIKRLRERFPEDQHAFMRRGPICEGPVIWSLEGSAGPPHGFPIIRIASPEMAFIMKLLLRYLS